MMNNFAIIDTTTKASKPARFDVPTHLLQPMWLRSRESLVDDALIYDPIAANACRYCHLSDDCVAGDIDQKQLLHATLTKLCDERVSSFLKDNPKAWVLNLGAGLDTRFYRLDNGLCHWVELDTSEHLLWREKLFHPSERYQLHCGSVASTDWLDNVAIPSSRPVLIVCDQPLLNCTESEVAHFVQRLSRYFSSGHACIIVAGDKTSTHLGQRLGSQIYQHGMANPVLKIQQWLPWYKYINQFSPLDHDCRRWKIWQRVIAKFPMLKKRVTPSLIEFCW